jgi:Zn-dependent protease
VAELNPHNSDPQYRGADYGYGTERPVQADIPATAAPTTPSRGSLATGALAVVGLLLKFKGIWLTGISTALTALLYAQVFGWAFGVGLVLLILIHESGHVLVARMMGLPVTLPVMIPFLGAFVQMKQAPRSVAQESLMAIGGPVVGSIAAALCYVGYVMEPASHAGQLLLGLAYFGFLINLFNLVPVTPLDGGRVLSLLSKWFNVAGLVVAAALLVFGDFRSPVLFLVLIFGAMSTYGRFRSTALNPAYYAVDTGTKVMIGSLYLALLVGLGLGMIATSHVLNGVG